MAEGADRILAKRLLLIPDAALWVPLPLPEEEYLKDFKTSKSKKEFIHLLGKAERVIKMPVTDNREEGYLAAGKYILENSDVLLAIWDGKPAQGMAGTGEIVTLARERGSAFGLDSCRQPQPRDGNPHLIGSRAGKGHLRKFPLPWPMKPIWSLY